MNSVAIILQFFHQFVSTGCHDKPRSLPDDRGQIHNKIGNIRINVKVTRIRLTNVLEGK